MPSYRPLWDRFIEKFEMVEDHQVCWIWRASTDPCGYGTIGFEKKIFSAHRLSYLFFVGTIPKNKEVCHTCDQRNCVNPAHLFLGTHRQNMRDASLKNRLADRKGEQNARAILNKDQVAYIRKNFIKRHRDFSAAALSRMFGTSTGAIHDVLKGRSWLHLGDE